MGPELSSEEPGEWSILRPGSPPCGHSQELHLGEKTSGLV